MIQSIRSATVRRNAKRIRWAQCPQLSELALMIDAIPPELRPSIVRAAITFERTDQPCAYFVGEIRSLFIDSLAHLFGDFTASLLHGAGRCNLEPLSQLSTCHDPAAVQLAVCDLLETLAVPPKQEGENDDELR